jgi:DNA-binding XRE family transcriptional regulator
MGRNVVEFFSIRQDGKNSDGRFVHSAQGKAMKSLLQNLVPRESRPERVGPRVTSLRETLKLSKAELADAIGLDRSSLTKIEKGQAGLDIATGERIAQLYGFGLDFIYRGDLSDVPLDLRPALLVHLHMYQNRA